MDTPVDLKLLAQKWVHSHEEDGSGTRVFRPAGYKFPPSRGRRAFDLKSDGTMVDGQIGADDRGDERPARWKLEPGNELQFVSAQPAAKSEKLKIVALSTDKLVVRNG